ncbi:polyphosphate kinase 1 [Desulfurella multipotens]|jgi:polyphosphate kinase|uniref:polyphosphate kinase 1 n=3 Tax=Desulfurellaceae TaxID=117942 RepID=UPI000CCB0E35|nr:polyphosphate kinase 1 [Desulfurella multipotens]PMP65647.1 MAG: polyphosphate kinase 1 [Desulfurella multipotens]HEX13759.1 polyphosphate kinase 1 [Desulfurella acetivorans]
MSNFIYNNRELSWLDFNYRVLKQAINPTVPLLEKLKFVAIHASNLDEFFMVRVAGLKDQVDAGYDVADISMRTPKQQLEEISTKVSSQVKTRNDIFENHLKPQLKSKRILINPKEYLSQVEEIFYLEILPVLTPVALNNINKIPFIQNLTSVFFVELEKDSKLFYSILIIPGVLPKSFKIKYKKQSVYYTTNYIVEKFLNKVYTNYNIKRYFLFRLTRNADLPIHQELSEDLLEAIEHYLDMRKKSNVVRLEIDREVDKYFIDKMIEYFDIEQNDIYITNGLIDFSFIFNMQETKKSLYYESFKPAVPLWLQKIEKRSFFEVLKSNDIFFIRPYHDFKLIIKFLEEAVLDKNVLSLKITLYRTNDDSKIIELLEKAAKNGKHVSVVIELKARFDEEKNVEWAKRLENAGCIVTYGFLDLKIHAKCMLVVRKEANKLVRYTHISTGNYNEKTALVYTDIDYLTKDELTGQEIINLFNYMMGYSDIFEWQRIKISPKNLRDSIINLIDNEIKNTKKGKKGRIIAKLNSLYDKQISDKLYEASLAGVKIDLIVRGLCSVVPKVKNMSENITVKSIIGRFLEHARILYFYDNGNERMFISTADWMVRNFDKRIEILYEIHNFKAKKFLKSILNINLSDKTAWELVKYTYKKPHLDNTSIGSQELLLKSIQKIL